MDTFEIIDANSFPYKIDADRILVHNARRSAHFYRNNKDGEELWIGTFWNLISISNLTNAIATQPEKKDEVAD